MAAALRRLLRRGKADAIPDVEEVETDRDRMEIESEADSSSSRATSSLGGHTRMTTDNCSGTSSVQRVQSAGSVPGRKEDDFASILDDEEICEEFRVYLRTTLDNNKSVDPTFKKKFEVQLDFILIARQIFSAAEEDQEQTVRLMIDIGERFLAKPPAGYNIALSGQRNREDLVRHCKNLREGVENEVDSQLLRPGYEHIYTAVSRKYDLFKKTRPRTTLQILLCAIT